MYNNPYNSFYGAMPPVAPQYSNYGANQFNQQQQLNTNKIYVSGIEDVKSKNQSMNSDMIYLDNDKPLLYQKIVDGSGHFETKVFDIVPHTESTKQEESIDLSSYVKTSDLEPVMAEIKALKKQVAEIYVDKKTKEA